MKLSIKPLTDKIDPTFINAGSFLMSLFVNSALGMLFWLIAARYFNSSDVGIISGINSVINLFVVFSLFGMDTGLIRFLPEKNAKEQYRLINSANILSGTTSALLCAIITFISIFIIKFEPFYSLQSNLLFIISFIFLGSVATVNILQEYMIASARDSHYILIKNFVGNIAKIVLLGGLILLVLTHGYLGLYLALLISLLLAFALSSGYFLPKSFPKYRFGFQFDYCQLKEILPFSFSNYLEVMVNAIPLYIFPIFIANFIGLEETAYFYIAWYMGYFLFDISATISKVMVAEITTGYKQELSTSMIKRLYMKALIYMLLSTIPLGSVLFLFPNLILSFFGNNYAMYASALLRILVIAGIITAFNNLLLIYHRVEKNSKSIAIINGSFFLVSIGLCLPFLTIYGMNGLGYVWLLGQFIGLVINFFLILTYNFKKIRIS